MKPQRKRTVLVLDDDEINLMILAKNAKEAGYAVQPFTSSEVAFDHLMQHPDQIDIILLDKMLPGVSGLELLQRIKHTESLKHIPVIIQTGDAGVDQMREGLESGAYYYLTKPFHPEILTAILHSAENECAMREELLAQEMAGHAQFINLLREGEFTLRTHEEARFLAATLSHAAENSEFVALGLMALLSNAIEHGNLDIGHERKRKALLTNSWARELAVRAGSAEYGGRAVHIHMSKTTSGLHLVIRDEGRGFDWQSYLGEQNTSDHLNEPNGRGIAQAMIMLDEVRYVGTGNEVHCDIGLQAYVPVSQDAEAAVTSRHN